MIGLDYYGAQFFRSPGSVMKDIFYVELKNGIYDELEVREATNIDKSSVKSDWNADTRAIFKFVDDLEGGNIQNSGLKIVSFQIRRRNTNELNGYTLATIPFQNNVQLEYTDYTQSNGDLIYSIVPLAENALDGKAMSVGVKSDFVGWFLVDQENSEIVAFDKSIGSIGSVDTQLNQGRTVIETLSRYPSVFYSEKNYSSFSLSTVLIPEEFQRSGQLYEDFLSKFVYNHKPFLIKSGDGRVFIADISNPKASAPQNTWNGYDYVQVTIDAVEVASYSDYMNGVV